MIIRMLILLLTFAVPLTAIQIGVGSNDFQDQNSFKISDIDSSCKGCKSCRRSSSGVELSRMLQKIFDDKLFRLPQIQPLVARQIIIPSLSNPRVVEALRDIIRKEIIQGPQGLAGLVGPQGLAGLVGPEGIAGIIGPAGIAGLIGPAGLAGLVGPAGIAGIAGIIGPAGLAGLIGPAGLAGIVGPQGLAGLVGPAGPRGASGAAGASGAQGIPGGIQDFADFFALRPPDNAATVGPGTDVAFPQDGPSSGSGLIARMDATSFNLADIGVYQVFFQVSVTEAGQLILTLNGADLPYTVVGRATGTSQLVGMALVETTVINSILTVRNPAGNSTALTVTPVAGGTRPVSAHLMITRIK